MKKTISIALVTAMLVTFLSVFAAAATSVTISVTPPSVGATVGSVAIVGNTEEIFCFDFFSYDTLTELKSCNSYESYNDFISTQNNLQNAVCTEGTKYVAAFPLDSEGSEISSVNPSSSEFECGVLFTEGINGVYTTGIYVVFTPAAASDDSSSNSNTSSGSTDSDSSDILQNTTSTSSHPVTVTYEEAAEPMTIYKVDIVYGSMEFTYTEDYKGVWDPETHTYKDEVAGGWSYQEGDNAIAVTNHSNAAVDVTFSYAADDSFNAVSGTFSNSSVHLDSAENSSTDNAPSSTVNLTLSGTINESFAETATCGTVTVTFK